TEEKVPLKPTGNEHKYNQATPILMDGYFFPKWFIWFASVFMSGALPWATWVTHSLIIIVNSSQYQDPDLIKLRVDVEHLKLEAEDIKLRILELERGQR